MGSHSDTNGMEAKDERRLSDSEIAQLVAEEFARPMIRASKEDQDAFDFFASQPRRKSELLTYACGSMFCASIALFVGSLVIVLGTGTTTWPLGMVLVACALGMTATLLGTFCR